MDRLELLLALGSPAGCVVGEDAFLVVAAAHDMVNRAGLLDAPLGG